MNKQQKSHRVLTVGGIFSHFNLRFAFYWWVMATVSGMKF